MFVVAKQLDGLRCHFMEMGFGLGDFVLDGDPAPPEKNHSPTQFSTHVYCFQMASGMKTPLGTDVDLGAGHIMLDGDPAPLCKRAQQRRTLFGPCLLWPRSPISATAELVLYSA